MKKIALILAVITAVLMLASCGDDKENVNVVTEDVHIDVNTGKKTNNNKSNTPGKTYDVTPGIQDYDNDGNLILTSTANRYVYHADLGYVIFSFDQNTDSCLQVLEVRSLDSEEAAKEYLTKNVAEMMSSGNYLNVQQAKNNVIFTVSLDNPLYGKYLKLHRSDVETDMPEALKCN